MLEESERDELVMTLVDAALGQEPESRSSYLRGACGGDADLWADVAERVDWEERMGDFLQDPVIDALGPLAAHPFDPGELVDGRFRIVREVGRGGMGVVYQALDEKLCRAVALKTAKSGYGHRLPPEARAAREVSHPNVCDMYDIHSIQTELGEMEFLSMEFVHGETLASYLLREGAMAPAEARDIALQICAGLGQAHRQGVVHGDLKPGNVILTEAPGGGRRAVITDFGLARLAVPDPDWSGVNEQGGSFDYMAPELFSGAAPSAASDFYALGVIFHEMVTGKKPARIEPVPSVSSKSTTVTIDRPPALAVAPRRCEPMPAPWNTIVKRCLEQSPDRRFRAAGEIAERLEAPRLSLKWLLAVPAAAAILGFFLWQGREPAMPATRLAVLPFEVEGNVLQSAAGLGLDIADRLARLRQRGFVVIPPGEAQRNKVETPERAKAAFAATHVLRTRLQNSAGQIIAKASVVDAGTGQVLQELNGKYAANDLTAVAKAIQATVTGAFHLRAGVPLEVLAAAAYPAYVQGLNLLRRDGTSADEAIPFLQKAIELDPGSALPYAALAESQVQKFQRGYGPEWLDRAAQSVAKAQTLNPDSSPVLLASGLYKQQHGWYEQAAQDFSRALEVAPNDSEALKRLAAAYAGMGRPTDAIASYRKAIDAQPGYYAPYLELGLFYYFRGQFQEAEQLFRRVVAIAPGFARGHMDLGLVLKEQRRFDEAEQSLLTSLRLQETSAVLTNLGALYYEEERFNEAAEFFEKSLNAEADAIAYEDLGDAYLHLGRREASQTAYRTAQRMAESEVVQNPRDPFSRALLARLCAQLGERSRAEFEILQALSLKSGITRVIRTAVLTFEALGQRPKSLQVLEDAPGLLLQELSHQPDLKDLQRDPRFLELLNRKASQQ